MGEMPEMDYDDWTFTVSMVMNAGCETMMYPEEYATIPWADVPEGYTPSTNYYHVEEVLTRPIGECTTNVIGSSVIFVCMGDYIAEHVYIDASQGAAPEIPDCSGDLMYTMPIYNGCTGYTWGSMKAVWDGYCMESCEDVNHIHDNPGFYTCDCVAPDDPCLSDEDCVP